MKKILLATTILGMSAGYASAEIAWSASAAAGIASDNWDDFESDAYSSDGDYQVYSSMKIGVKGSAETDSGLTFGAATDFTIGTTFARGDDLGDGFEDKSDDHTPFGMPTISVGGAFGTIAFSLDNFDYFDDTNDGGDVKYTGTFGAVNVGVISNVDNGDLSVQLGYSANGITVSADADNLDNANLSVAYTMGAITGKLSTTEDEFTTIKLSYAADAISGSIEIDSNDDYTLTAGYTANGLTIGVEADNSDYTKVTGSYDLGGGLSVEAGADSDESVYLGAAMKF